MSLESPCAPRVSRTLSEMLQLISKGRLVSGRQQEQQNRDKEAEMQRDGERWAAFAALGMHNAHLRAHTHTHSHGYYK